AALYAVYHGPKGLKQIATRVHTHAVALERALADIGIRQVNGHYFDTPRFEVPGGADATGRVVKAALASRINLGDGGDGTIRVALDETVGHRDISAIVTAFAAGLGRPAPVLERPAGGQVDIGRRYPAAVARTSPF